MNGPTIPDFVQQVASERGIDPARIYGPRRDGPTVYARHRAIQRAWEWGYSANAIAKALGRDHTTILNALGRKR